MIGITGEQLVDRDDEARRERRAEPREVGRVALQAGERRVGIGLAEERNASGKALVEHEPERVEVGSAVESFAADLLRRQVLGGPHHHVVAREIVVIATVQAFGDAEVGQQHPTAGCDHDVAGLDVAVDEARLVGVIERRGDTGSDVARELGAQALLVVEHLAQRLAVDELHDDRLAPFGLEHVVHRDDVRMVQTGGRDSFSPEPFGDHRIDGE